MKFGIVKAIAKAATKSKNTIVKHGPQIMAVAGAACFIGATVCAIKETPKAMAKLEEKKALDPDMTTLQKMAVAGPEYKTTMAFTAAGVGLTLGAWKFEADKVAKDLAAVGSVASIALDKNTKLVEEMKKQVGEEKTEEIVKTVDEKAGYHYTQMKEGADTDANPPESCREGLFCLSTTKKCFWMKKDEVEKRLCECRAMLRLNKVLSLIDVYSELGLETPELGVGWMLSQSDFYGWSESDVRNEFDWEYEPYEDDYGRLGWMIRFTREPSMLPD